MHKKKDNDFLINRTYNKFVAAIKGFYVETSSNELPQLLEQVKAVEALAANKQSMLLLYSLSTSDLLYIGSNVKDIFGYDEPEIRALGEKVIFKLLDTSHLGFPLVSLDWSK